MERWVFCAFCALVLTASGLSQPARQVATIRDTALQAEGLRFGPLMGARVTVLQGSSRLTSAAINAQSEHAFSEVRPGTYRVRLVWGGAHNVLADLKQLTDRFERYVLRLPEPYSFLVSRNGAEVLLGRSLPVSSNDGGLSAANTRL